MFRGEKSEWVITDDDCCQLRRTDELGISNIFEMYQITSYPGKHCKPPRDTYYVIQHAIVDVLKFPEEDILDALHTFGYESMDDFVIQTSPVDPFSEAVYDKNGLIDRVNSPNYIIDYGLIAEMLFEQACQTTECNEPVEYDTWDDAVIHLAVFTGCNDLWGKLENAFSLNSEDNASMEFVLKDMITGKYAGAHSRDIARNGVKVTSPERNIINAEHFTASTLQNWLKLGMATIHSNVLTVDGGNYLIERVLPAYQGSPLKVQWVNLDEGFTGDYDPNDPEDVNLLRFDVYQRTAYGWEAMENGSHCTLMDAKTPALVLKYAAQYIYERLTDATTNLSVSQIMEECTYIHAESIYPIPGKGMTKQKLAEFGYSHGNMLPISSDTAMEMLSKGQCPVYCIPKGGDPFKVYCFLDVKAYAEKGHMFGVYDDDWCRYNLRRTHKHGVNHYTSSEN